MGFARGLLVFGVLVFAVNSLNARILSFASPGYIPEPNEEVTVQIKTDVPLFCMGAAVYITGDAEITTAMCEADCNSLGWDNGWNSDPHIDPNGWLYLSGVSWPSEPNNIVSYFKFIYHGGEVVVSFDTENSCAFDADFQTVPVDNNSLVFGQSQQNMAMMISEESSSQADTNMPATSNEINSPAPILLIACQVDSNNTKYSHANTTNNESVMAGGDTIAMPLSVSYEQMLMGQQSVIEISSDITTNQVWTADNVYHVTDQINVQSLLVIEPNTTVRFAANSGMFINNGGTLISKGTPDKLIVFKSDIATLQHGYYYCPIYIQSTASAATTVEYSYIDSAKYGIVTDNIRLDKPLENNFCYYNSTGIAQWGPQHTDVINNLVYYSDISGIDVNMASVTGQTDATSSILIENNTCHAYQYFGIMVSGAENEADAGTIELYNNIVSNSYTAGLNLGGWAIWLVKNTGYYGNIANTNDNLPENNPVIAMQNPYVAGSGYFDICYLSQTCPFINAGTDYIEQTHLIGTTTALNSTPDANLVDLGFHYANWNFTNAGTGLAAGDMNKDAVTDYKDLWEITSRWLTSVTPGSTGDLNNDGHINLIDFTTLAASWQKTQGEPNITVAIPGNVNNLAGHVQLSVSGSDSRVYRVLVLLDGLIQGEFGDLENGSFVGIDTTHFSNGNHSLKTVSIYDGHVATSSPIAIAFNNQLSNLTMPAGFTPGKDYHIYALGQGNLSVSLYDAVNETTTLTSNCQNGLSVNIPSTAFVEPHGIYNFKANDSVEDIINFVIGRKFKKEDFPPNVNIGMLISIGSEDLQASKEKCWKSAVKAAVKKGIWPVLLKYEDCTWDNVKYCLNLNNVKMWYHLSHMNYDLAGQPQRSCICVNGTKVFSYLRKDFVTVPPNYQNLWWWYENNPSIAELGFQNSSKMTWTQFNGCYSARTTEFATQLGILPIKDPMGIGKQIFVGWYNSAKATDMVEHYNEYEKRLWGYLQTGNMLKYAFEESIIGLQGGLTIQQNFRYYGVVDYQYAWFRYPNIN